MRNSRLVLSVFFAAGVCALAQYDLQSVPDAWNDAHAVGYRVPLAGLGHAPKMVSGAEYYKLPEYNLKTYPVYAPEKEPKTTLTG